MSATDRRARQKDFVRRFNALTGRHSGGELWRDWVQLVACAISNALPGPHREAREKLYMDIAGKHDPATLHAFAVLNGMLVDSMDASVAENDYGDFLGELFMELELGNSLGGQFFTPYNLCAMMARMQASGFAAAIRADGWATVHDCACGAGATLIGAAQAMREAGIDYQRDALFVGQDIDGCTALMCYIQLSYLGCPGYVRIGNSLTDPPTGSVLENPWKAGPDTWFTPIYHTDAWALRLLKAR